MSSGTASATSTYSPGKGMSFAKDIGSRVLAAAQSAKGEKKLQEKIEKEGGEVPESAKKGLFGRALKQQFVTNPINDLKKNFNKKLSGAAGIIGLFGGKGRALEDKMMAKKFSLNKGGFDRSGYKRAQKEKPKTGGGGGAAGAGGGGGAGGGIPTLGALVLDIQAIASAVSSMQGLISTQMSISSKMADSLGEIKSILGEQVSLQQQRIENEEMAAMEASLESSQQVSGTDKATSTVTEGGGLLSMLGDLQSLFGILKSLPSMFMGLLRGLVSKIPGGKFLLEKLGGGAAKKLAGEAVGGGAKSLLGKFLRPIFKRIPFVGGLIDFAVSMALGEPVGRAAAKAAGYTLGGALGGFLGSVFPGPGTVVGGLLGGFAGDWVGSTLYDAIAGAFGGDKEQKMSGGGVMIGEAGKEAVVDLNSAQGKSQLGGGPDMDSVGQSYYSAIAGSTLAVTKEFIDGMGPIGAAVAPVIQDDIAKLGQTFELPSTSIKMSVGGAGLSPVPGAEKKGEKFLEDLVRGSLEKVNSGKEKTKTDGGGGSGGSGGGDTGSSGGDTGSGAAAPAGAAPAGGPPAPVTAASFGSSQLAATTTSQTTTGGGRNTQTVTNVNNKNLQKVTGTNPGKYYYDGFGNVYSIDKDEKRILKPDQLKNGVPGAAGNFNFFRNTNTGVVSLATHQDATSSGFYDYAANAVREPGFGPSGEQKNIWVHVNDAKQYKGQFTEATPYGKSKISAEDGASATLKKLGNGKLADAPRGLCVTGVLETMAANKIPNPPGTGNDGNNPRGLASQLIKNYGWGSISGLGSKNNLKSPYGNVGVNTMNLGEWKTAVKSNKIPSGAIVFMTRNNDWSGNRSSGHDASIAKDGGKKLWSGHWQAQSDGVGAVYGGSSNKIIALTPGGQQIPYDGSTSGDDGEDREGGDGTPENPFEAMEAGLKAMLVGAMVMAGNPKDKAEFEKLKKDAEASDAVTKMFGSTGNVTTPTTPAAPTRNTRGGGTSSPAAGSPQVIHVPTGSTPPLSLGRPAAPMSGTPGSLSPVRGA